MEGDETVINRLRPRDRVLVVAGKLVMHDWIGALEVGSVVSVADIPTEVTVRLDKIDPDLAEWANCLIWSKDDLEDYGGVPPNAEGLAGSGPESVKTGADLAARLVGERHLVVLPPDAEIDRFECIVCGGSDVEVAEWIRPNAFGGTGEIVGNYRAGCGLVDPGELADPTPLRPVTWCETCGDHTPLRVNSPF